MNVNSELQCFDRHQKRNDNNLKRVTDKSIKLKLTPST